MRFHLAQVTSLAARCPLGCTGTDPEPCQYSDWENKRVRLLLSSPPSVESCRSCCACIFLCLPCRRSPTLQCKRLVASVISCLIHTRPQVISRSGFCHSAERWRLDLEKVTDLVSQVYIGFLAQIDTRLRMLMDGLQPYCHINFRRG